MSFIPNKNRLSSERYLINKDYFDSGLIELLEKQQNQIEKLKKTNAVQKAAIAKKSQKATDLTLQLKDKKIIIYNLKMKLHETSTEAEDAIKQLEKEIQDISSTVRDELQKSYKDNTMLYNENTALKEELERLRKKMGLKKNSTNSSIPSSKDMFFERPNTRKKSVLKKGGQKGHAVHLSKLDSSSTKIIKKHVKSAPKGADCVMDENNNILYYRIQEINLVCTAEIYETRYYIDESGETLSKAEMSRYAVNSVSYDPHFVAAVLYLNNKGGIALKRLCMMLNEISGGKITLSPSTICKWMKRFNIKSNDKRKAILDKLLQSYLINVDETGWKTNGTNAWMHVLTTPQEAYFIVTEKRSDKETGPLKVLEEYSGVVVHDHFKPYLGLENCIHAECNAHILRYLQAGADGWQNLYCTKMIALLKKINTDKKKAILEGKTRFEDEQLNSYEEQYLKIANESLKDYKEKNPDMPAKYKPDYVNVFKRLIKYKDEHLLFMHDFSVPFDNNAAERQCRAIKAKKKISGQSGSIETAGYFASMLTVMQTCSLQNKNTLDEIEDILR